MKSLQKYTRRLVVPAQAALDSPSRLIQEVLGAEGCAECIS